MWELLFTVYMFYSKNSTIFFLIFEFSKKKIIIVSLRRINLPLSESEN